ncbi:hypothetical protein J9303_21005 [Bacillaceae bacterium Marseille-Q3522]|nr:hypothetical protein [Bacillaceae bacterium Marseille-Q3522]
MSEIQIKIGELEAFADEMKKAEQKCEDALDILEHSLTSLYVLYPGDVPDSIEDLDAEFRHSIQMYQNKLMEAREFIHYTVAEMLGTDQEIAEKNRNGIDDFFSGIYDGAGRAVGDAVEGWKNAYEFSLKLNPVTKYPYSLYKLLTNREEGMKEAFETVAFYRRLRGSNTPSSKLEVKPIKLGGG